LLIVERWLKPVLSLHAEQAAHKKEVPALLHPRETPDAIAMPERLLGKWQVAVLILLAILLGIFLLLQLTS